jgi:hypothetical protein
MLEFKKNLIAKGYTADDMDALVHDAASQAASSVNNEGLDGQVRYLLEQGWTEKNVLEALEDGRGL